MKKFANQNLYKYESNVLQLRTDYLINKIRQEEVISPYIYTKCKCLISKFYTIPLKKYRFFLPR